MEWEFFTSYLFWLTVIVIIYSCEPAITKMSFHLLGFMIPSGSVTSKTRENANTKLANWFSLKESHSIAETLWNHGLEWLSMRQRFALVKRSCCSKARIVAVPASDSAKWWRIGARCIPARRASSLAVGM